MTRILILGALLATSAAAQDFDLQIKTRQQAFETIEQSLERAEDIADSRDPNWQQLSKLSGELIELGNTVKNAFPKGSHKSSRAQTDIWEEPVKFNALMTQLNNGFITIANGSHNKNINEIEQGIEQAEDTCKSCHRGYRSLW